ncbi:MAG: GNAT family N-acetyltransferase [Anaerolineae bacterium]
MELSVRPAIDVPLETLIDLWNSAFADYVTGPVRFTTSLMAQFLYASDINLNFSQVAYGDDRPAGIAMVSRQGWTVRLAGMGISADFQGKGIGKHLLSQLLEQARGRGDRQYVLKLSSRTNALSNCMRTWASDHGSIDGLHRRGLAGDPDPALTEIDIYEVAQALMQHGDPKLPWQVSGSHIMRYGAPTRAYRLGNAVAAISDPNAANIRLIAMIVAPAQQHQGEGSRLLRALAGKYVGKQWFVPPICPQRFGEFLVKHGFKQDRLNQVLME